MQGLLVTNFYGPNEPNSPASVNNAGKYEIGARWGSEPQPMKMIPVTEGFCFLTRVAGAFAGSGEQVTIDESSDGFWQIHVTSGQQAGTYANARCVAYNQSRSAAL